MERVLSKPEPVEIERLFAQSFDSQQPVMYYPVRHHSPACALHLQHVIGQYNPDIILIEVPADSMYLLPYIADESSVPPFCIYHSYDDKEGKVSEDREKYRAYYPFLSYSPELVAIREAAKRHIPSGFIDMPYGLRLINRKKTETDTLFYYNENNEYEVNSYTRMLVQRSGCRSFPEFWERYFELDAPKTDTRSFVKRIFQLGYFMRLATPQTSATWQENRQREIYMATEIRKKTTIYQRILVVTGAFHVAGIMNSLNTEEKQSLHRYAKDSVAVYLMPYSFKETDSRNGYMAGMSFPGFYQTIWEKMQKNEPNIYESTVLSYIMKTAQDARKDYNITLPDEINALSMARALAILRGKPTTGVYELIDGIKSCYIKGSVHEGSTFDMDCLLRLLSGTGFGKIVAGCCVPPVVKEFRTMCSLYQLKTTTVKRQNVILNIIKNPLHQRKSRFLHQLRFLETGFSTLQSGPDYVNHRDKNLVRENWICSYNSQVETRLIDLSVFGSTLSGICSSMLEQQFKDNLTAEKLGKLLISVQVMGVEGFYQTYESAILQVIEKERNFVNLCRLLSSLHYLARMQQLTDNATNTVITKLKEKVFYEAIYQIPIAKNANGHEEQSVCEQMNNLYRFTLEKNVRFDIESFKILVGNVLENSFCNSRFYGLCLAIFYKMGHVPQQEFYDRITTYIESSIQCSEQAASFICGLFLVARDALFTDFRILQALDDIISRINDTDFLSILPNLRYAFTCFLPTELSRLGHLIAVKYHAPESHLSGSIKVSYQEVTHAMILDSQAAEFLKTWKL